MKTFSEKDALIFQNFHIAKNGQRAYYIYVGERRKEIREPQKIPNKNP